MPGWSNERKRAVRRNNGKEGAGIGMSTQAEAVDVSVVMLTYFHEDYIAQALDSVLSQETTLRYEIIIGDDASGDRTPDIIREYAARCPDIIRPVLRTKNLGANRNGWDAGRRARGKYIAYLEGDDYWLDPRKLQKQWEFLEVHPEYSACCGKCLIVDENGQPDYTRTPQFAWSKKVFTLEDLVDSWDIPGQAGTMMYRNAYRGDDTIGYKAHRNVGDKTTALLLLTMGPIYCSNEILTCYRYVNRKGKHNYFSQHYANPYRNYDMFMYPVRLETWARKNGVPLRRDQHFGKRIGYRFCRFVEECVRDPSPTRLKYLAEMVSQSHEKGKYCWYILKTLIEME